jgi:hypothetical protein
MPADPLSLSPDDRRRELAAILARGLRRLLRPRACDPVGPHPAPEKPSESREVCLEVGGETRLSVSPVGGSRDQTETHERRASTTTLRHCTA